MLVSKLINNNKNSNALRSSACARRTHVSASCVSVSDVCVCVSVWCVSAAVQVGVLLNIVMCVCIRVVCFSGCSSSVAKYCNVCVYTCAVFQRLF